MRLRSLQNSCPLVSSTTLPEQIQTIALLNDHVTDKTEDKFFALLGRQQATELRCASQFAEAVKGMSDSQLSDQIDRLKLLRMARKGVADASLEISTNSNIFDKTCPLDISELKNQPPYSGGEDLHFTACTKLIRNRSAFSTLLASFPLSNRRALTKFLDRSATQAEDPSDASLLSNLKAAYAATAKEIHDQAEKLENQIKDSGGAGLDRATRHVLLQDPRVVDQVIRMSGNDADVRGVACRADARYGAGADALNTDMMIGSFALGAVAGVASKVGTVGIEVVEGASAARASGLLSLSSTRMLQASALGMNTLSAFSAVDNACFSNAPTLGAQALNEHLQCVAAPKIEDLAKDSCVAKSILVGLSFEASAPAAARDLIRKIMSTPVQNATNVSINVTNTIAKSATGLPSATAITMGHIKICENQPCLKDIRFVAATDLNLSSGYDLSSEQKRYLDQVIEAKKRGQINTPEDANYWLMPNQGGAGSIGQFNSNQARRPFENRGSAPFFPAGVHPTDVISALQNDTVTRVSSAEGHGHYLTNYRGNRYRIQVCESDECSSQRSAISLKKGDVVTITPECGPDLRRAVSTRRAKIILMGTNSPSADDFYQSVPCP